MDVVLGHRERKMPRQPCSARIAAPEHASGGDPEHRAGQKVRRCKPGDDPAPIGGAVADRANKPNGIDRTTDALREFVANPSVTDLVGAATVGHSVLIGQPDCSH